MSNADRRVQFPNSLVDTGIHPATPSHKAMSWTRTVPKPNSSLDVDDEAAVYPTPSVTRTIVYPDSQANHSIGQATPNYAAGNQQYTGPPASVSSQQNSTQTPATPYYVNLTRKPTVPKSLKDT